LEDACSNPSKDVAADHRGDRRPGALAAASSTARSSGRDEDEGARGDAEEATRRLYREGAKRSSKPTCRRPRLRRRSNARRAKPRARARRSPARIRPERRHLPRRPPRPCPDGAVARSHPGGAIAVLTAP
jgi:hypothetical protein